MLWWGRLLICNVPVHFVSAQLAEKHIFLGKLIEFLCLQSSLSELGIARGLQMKDHFIESGTVLSDQGCIEQTKNLNVLDSTRRFVFIVYPLPNPRVI